MVHPEGGPATQLGCQVHHTGGDFEVNDIFFRMTPRQICFQHAMHSGALAVGALRLQPLYCIVACLPWCALVFFVVCTCVCVWACVGGGGASARLGVGRGVRVWEQCV